MLKISEILSKPLVSMFEAKREGIIKNIIFDNKLKCAKSLQIFCEDDNEPEEKFVNLKDVFCIGKDVVLIKNAAAIFYKWEISADTVFSPINADIFNLSGEIAGRICDVLVDPKKYTVCALISDSQQNLCAQDIAAVSGSVVIMQDKCKPIKLCRPIPKIPHKDQRIVSIEDDKKKEQPQYRFVPPSQSQKALDNTAQPAFSSKPLPPPDSSLLLSADEQQAYSSGENYTYYRAIIDNSRPVSVPERIPSDNIEVSRSPQKESQSNGYNFLLGKKVTLDIAGADGKIIIPANTIINLDTIEIAKNNGRIVQLALNS